MGAVLAQQTDQWAEQRRYLGLNLLAQCRKDPGHQDTNPKELTTHQPRHEGPPLHHHQWGLTTTSHAAYSKPADSDPNYTLKLDEPSDGIKPTRDLIRVGWVEYIGLRGLHGFAQVHIGGTFVRWREPVQSSESDALTKYWLRGEGVGRRWSAAGRYPRWPRTGRARR